MKVCISPSSLKLLSTYFNRKLPGIVTENKTYDQILTELYNEALSDFNAEQVSLAAEDISLEELILQHLTVAPQLISTYIATNPLLTGDFSSIKNELDENRASIIKAIQSDNTEDFKSVVENIGSAVGSKEIYVPLQQITIGRFEGIKIPLYTVINQEATKDEDGSYKLNKLDLKKEIVSKIQLKLYSSSNSGNLQFKLVNKNDVVNDPAFRETLTPEEQIKAGTYVLVLVNSNGDIVKFNEQGNLDANGVFPIFPLKTNKKAFEFQMKAYVENAKGKTKEQALSEINEEVNVYLQWLKDGIKQVQAGSDVFFTVDLSRSSQGTIEYHTLLATPIVEVANLDQLNFEINSTGTYKGAAVRMPNYDVAVPLRERAFEDVMSEEEIDLFIDLLTNNSLRYQGVSISKDVREKFIKSYMPTFVNNSTSGVGFEIKFDQLGQVTGIVLAGKNYTISPTKTKNKEVLKANIEKFRIAFKEHISKWHFVPVSNNYTAPTNYTVVEGKTEQEVLRKLNNIKQGQYVRVNRVPMILMKPTVSFGLLPSVTSIETGEIYRIDSIQNNILTLKTKPLKQHIIESTDTTIVVDSSKNLRPAFPYLAFNPTMPNTEDTAPSEDIMFQSIADKSRVNDLESNLFWNEETLAMTWLKDSGWLKVLNLVMRDEIHTKGPKFVASFIGNTISLWKGSNNTDLYHEVFHAYFGGLLTETQQNEIYDSLRTENKGKTFTVTVQGKKKTRSFDTATELELEEFLAEEFRKYARNRSKYNNQLKSPIARFFEILKDLFQRMFGNRSYSEIVTLGFVSNKVKTHFQELYDGQIDISQFIAPQSNFEKFQSFEFDQDINMTNAEMHKTMSTMQTLYVNYIDNVVNPIFASDEIFDQATTAWIDIARIDPLNKTAVESFEERFKKATVSFRTKYKQSAENFSGRNSIALQRNPRILLNAIQYIQIRMDQIRKVKLKGAGITEGKIDQYIEAVKLVNQSKTDENFNKLLAQREALRTELETAEKLIVTIESSVNRTDLQDVVMLTKALEYFGDYNVITEGFDALDGDNTSIMGIFLNNFTPLNLKGVEYVQDEKDINPEDWNFDKTGTEKKIADDVDAFTKFILSTLYDYQKSGRSTVANMSSLGMPKLLPFQTALVKVVNATANKGTTEEEMYEALVKASAKDNVLKQLVERLGDPANPNITAFEIDQWGNFWRSLNKADIKLLAYQLEKEDNAEKEESRLIAKVGKTHNNTNSQIKDWDFDFQKNLIDGVLDVYGDEIVNGKIETGLLPAAVKDKWGAIAYYIKGDETNYFTSIERRNQLEAQGIKVKEQVMWKMDPIGFYRDLGIDFSYSEELQRILLEGSEEYDIESKMTEYIYNSIVNREGAIKESQRIITSLKFVFGSFDYLQNENSKSSSKQVSLSGYLTKLANLALSLDEVAMSFMEYTAYGERMSTKSLHSSLSIELSLLNRTEIYDRNLKEYRPVVYSDLINTPGMQHYNYENNPEVSANLSIVKMYNLDKDKTDSNYGKRNPDIKITLQHLTGAKVVHNGVEKGVKSRKSDERTKFNTDFGQTLANYQEIMRTSDKSSSMVTNHPIKKDNETEVRKGLWINNLETFQIYQDNYNGTLLFDVFKGHIESELLRMTRLNKVQKRIDNGETVLFDPKFLARGKTWFKFSLLLSKSVKERLENLQLEESFTIVDAINEFDPTLIQDIEKDLKDYFGWRATQLHTEKDKTLTVADNVSEEYTLEDESPFATRMRLFQIFIINNYIQNLNYGTFLGDPANYGVSEEAFHKRIAGKISTGRMMRHSESWYNYINSTKYERDGFSKQHFDSLSQERKQELGLSNTYQERIYNGHLQTAILLEAQSDSIYRKHYEELLGIPEKKYSEMKEADGAAYISFDTYRLLSKSHQEWSDDQEAVYQAMLRGENINQLKTKATFPVRKYQEYGPLLNADISEQVRLQLISFHKYSVIPLIPTLIKDNPLEQVHQMMMEQGIDYVTFQTGSKLSNVVRINQDGAQYDDPYVITKEKATIDGKEVDVDVRSLNRDIKFTKNTIHVRHLKSVSQQSEGYHGTVTLPSQMRKINLTGLFDKNDVPRDYKGRKMWKNLSYKEQLAASDNFRWIQEYISTMDNLVAIARDEIVEDLGLRRVVNPTTGEIEYSGTTEKFAQYIREQLSNKQLTSEEVDFIYDKSTGQLIPDLSLSLNSSKIEEVLIKLADDELRRLEVNGEPLVQVPGTMLEGVVERPRLASTEEVFQYGNNGLSTYYGLKEDGTIATSEDNLKYVKSMEIKISLQGDFKKLLYTEFQGQKIIQYETVFDEKTKKFKYQVDFDASLARLNEALLDEEWLDLYEEFISLPATRIPTSQFSMLESARIKEFLPPIAGPIVILPSEIVAKSGSDFDIDKLFSLFGNIVNINGNIELATYVPGITESRTELQELVDQARMRYDEVQKKIDALYAQKKNIWKQSDKINDDLRNLLSVEYDTVDSLKEQRDKIKAEAEKVYKKQGKYKNWSAKKVQKFHHGENGSVGQIKELNEQIEYIENQINEVTSASIGALYKPLDDQIEALKKNDLVKANDDIDLALRRLYGKSRKAIENKIVSLLNERITNPLMFKSLVEPNSTDMFDDLAEDLSRKLTKAYNKFDHRNVEDVRNKTTEAKIVKNDKDKPIIANSTIFDYRYNLLKHQENFKGMDALGIAAVTSTYYALLTQFGGTLNGLSEVQQKEYNDALFILTRSLNGESVNENILAKAKETLAKYPKALTLKFPHNKDGNKIALGYLENIDGKTIQDVIGQLINGFVDVAANPWIFNVQGNMQNIPQMLLMVMAGMKVDDVVNFASLPMVIEYNTLKDEMKGVFSGITKEYKKAPFASSNTKTVARVQMLERYQEMLIKDQLEIMPDDEYNAFMANSLNPLDLMADNYLSDRVTQDITEDNVADHYRLLAHYFQVEDMAEDFTAFTMATKFDTQKPQSLTEYQARLDELEKLRANTKSAIPFMWYERLLDKDTNGIFGSILGIFNNDQFIIDLFANRFAIRNNPMTIKKSLFADRPKNVDKELAYIGFKDDFGFFLYQNAFFRSQNYDGYEFVANENIQVPINVEGNTIYYSPALIEGSILDFNIKYEAEFFPTKGHYLRYRVELEKIEAEFAQLTAKEIRAKYYYIGSNTTSFVEIKDKLALWRSRNNVAFFDMRMGVVTMIENMKKKHPDLVDRFQLIADLRREYTLATQKANFYINDLEDPLLVNTYKENLADLKNSEYPEVAELFELFDHLAMLQAGASSSGITNLSRIIDQSKFYTTIEEEIGVSEIVKQLEEGVSQMRQGIPMKDIKVPLLDQFVEVYQRESVPKWYQRKKGLNLMVDEFEYESQGKALNNLSTVLVKAYTKFDGVNVPEPKLILENLLVDVLAEKGIVTTQPIVSGSVSQTNKPKGVQVKEGIYVNQAALTKEEQLELFDYLKPFLEEQAARTLKGSQASKMIGLGLRWDYKNNNTSREAVDIPDVINPGNKTKYGYYDQSINGQPLGQITPRFKELMQKATGVDMTNYDGAIINLYEKDTFISSHNDVDESKSAIKYPVIGINIGGKGNFSIERLGPENERLDLEAGTGYIFGVDGINRNVWHRTFPTPQDSFLPELTTKIDGKTYPAGSYRVTITMRRVMPLTQGMPQAPSIVSETTQPAASIDKGAKLDLNSPSLDINWEFLEAVKGKPVAVINKTKFHVQDEYLQEALNEVLMDYFGIDNTGDTIEIRPKSIGQTKDNISIAFSEEKRAKHSFVDEQMANSSSIAIGKETDMIAKPSVATYYATEIQRLYPEKLASKTTKFKETDKVWIFGSGVFESSYAGKMSKEQWQGLVENDFNKNYKPLIDKAIKAGVSVFNIGTATGIDQLALKYLKDNGFYAIPKYTLAGSYNQVVSLDKPLEVADDYVSLGATSVSFKDVNLSFVLDKKLEEEINKYNEKSLLTGDPYLKVEASILDKLRQLQATNIQQAKYVANILVDIAGQPISATGAIGIYRGYVEQAIMEIRNQTIAKRKNIEISAASIATVQVKQRLESDSGMEMNFKDGSRSKDKKTDQWYTLSMLPQFKGQNTFDLSVSGDRTRTTRTAYQVGQLLNIYGFRNPQELVGMLVPMTENTTDPFTKKDKIELRRAYVRITKVSKFTQEYQDQTWQKEGWEKYVTDVLVGNYDWAIEYEFVKGGSLTNEDLKQIKPCQGG